MLTSSSIFDDMTTLCKMFCPDDLKREMHSTVSGGSTNHSEAGAGAEARYRNKAAGEKQEVGEEEEQEQEEEEEEEEQ